MRRAYKLLFVILLFSISGYSCGLEGDVTLVAPAPKLTSTTPSNGAVDQNYGALNVILNFDSKVELASPFDVSINGSKVSLSAKVDDDKVVFELVDLIEDTNYNLRITKGNIYATGNNDDVVADISINFTTKPHLRDPNNPLVLNDPSKEALALYGFLKENLEKTIISGSMSNVSWNINEAEWVKQHTGTYPAMIGLDYIHLNAGNTDYSDTSIVEDWWANNGLITICWHWNVPIAGGSSKYAFYTYSSDRLDGTIFDISKVTNKSSYEYKYMVEDMEKVADKLLLIKNKKIPILWRPMHEASGGWFWWGAKGPEAFKQTWRLMFDIFKAKGLDNLIWVWTAETGDNNWYPGDEYVDIVGRDKYRTTASNLNLDYDKLQALYPDKIITLSEFGSIADDSELFSDGKWSWFMPWYDYQRTKDMDSEMFKSKEHTHTSETFWESSFNNPRVISRDEMKDLK